MKILATFAFAVLLSAGQQTVRDAAPRQVPAGTGVLSGIVVSGDSSKTPIRRVMLTLNGGDVTNVLAVTGDDGRFTFRQLPAGRYTLTAARPGFVTVSYGATKPERAGTPIPLRDGQQMTDLTIPMLRGGVISGTVTDETGAPARDVRVRAIAIARRSPSGQHTYQFSINQGEPVDDRGAFRLFGLPPGEYVIAALPTRPGTGIPETNEEEFQRALQQGRNAVAAPPAVLAAAPLTGAAPVYFPGVFAAGDARPVRLGPAEEATGISFAIRPAPLTRVGGRLTTPDGQPASGVQVRLSNVTGVPLVGLTVPSPSATDRDGRFTIAGLPPGRYVLIATWPPGNPGASPTADAAAPLWAAQEFVADGHAVETSLQLRRGVRVGGALIFESGGAQRPPSDFSRVRVTMLQVLGEGERALFGLPTTPDATGSFVFNGATPGRYRFHVTAPGGTPANPVWFVKSATLNGRDLIDTPLVVSDADIAGVQVTLTDRPAVLTGAMQDPSGQPAPEYSLIAFPKDRALWVGSTPRIQQTRPAADGSFVFRGLPPGEYLVSAVTDIQPGELYDPAFLEQLIASALPVTLTPGEPAVLTMRVK